MVGTNDNRKTRRIELRGQLRQRTINGVYSYRLTVANGTRKEFFLRTSNYDEAIQKASELDSIWIAPTQEVALAQMNAIRGFSVEVQKNAEYFRFLTKKKKKRLFSRYNFRISRVY